MVMHQAFSPSAMSKSRFGQGRMDCALDWLPQTEASLACWNCSAQVVSKVRVAAAAAGLSGSLRRPKTQRPGSATNAQQCRHGLVGRYGHPGSSYLRAGALRVRWTQGRAGGGIDFEFPSGQTAAQAVFSQAPIYLHASVEPRIPSGGGSSRSKCQLITTDHRNFWLTRRGGGLSVAIEKGFRLPVFRVTVHPKQEIAAAFVPISPACDI
ncbi:hypothetical protein B0T22DRAFT_451501 [Podospora appendiculata]|uniref:Uncharacterized protein n=1 Tax=Podospora appendiculata TaxID=314037 RepID=A0AAE0XIT0_9PEZI|nr:hypothetical protein B0T22DRAFT_451501 [Podospora appendiculata]